MNDIQIALADFENATDRAAFLEMLDQYSRDPFGSGKPLPNEISEVLPDRWANHPGAFSLIVWQNEKPIAMANCLTSFSTFNARPRINIHDLVVSSHCRGLGLGRRLIEAVCDEARRREACQVTLEVRADNEHARKLYERSGFVGIESPVVDGTHFFGVRKLPS
jgi:ribosomal protein S18 acetylase RimI-like enzyme